MTALATSIEFYPARPDDVDRGLLAWAACTIRGLRVQAITVRVTLEGRLCVRFPARRDRAGTLHTYVIPVDSQDRREIEREILDAFRSDRRNRQTPPRAAS